MIKTEDIDYKFTGNIVCPYCGIKNLDSWEVNTNIVDGSLGIIECDCGKKFMAQRYCKITYSTKKAPCMNGEEEHQWEKIVGIPKEFFEGKYRCKICGSEKFDQKDCNK